MTKAATSPCVQPRQAGEVDAPWLQAGIEAASLWLEENRDALDEGGDGDVRALVLSIAEIIHRDPPDRPIL